MLTPVQSHASDPSEAFLFPAPIYARCVFRINNLGMFFRRSPSPSG